MGTVVKIKKLRENAVLPKRATEGSAGADLYACIDDDITIRPGELAMIPTGIAIELPDSGMGAFLFIQCVITRSGVKPRRGNPTKDRCC